MLRHMHVCICAALKFFFYLQHFFFLLFHRDVPKALVASFAMAISLFVLTNLAYYMVLTPQEAIQSDAVAMVRR